MSIDVAKLRSCIENSEKVAWKISEVLPDDFQISYARRFLPPEITRESSLTFLNDAERMHLNHIWGASYFNIFAFVEEYITLFSLSMANDSSFKESDSLRAFVRFSEEEIKHQQLFRKYLSKFEASFGSPCELLGNAREVASTILSNSNLCVLILTYHLELITQQHYRDSVKTDEALDEKFKEILRCHWQEEAQHARLDLLKIQEVGAVSSEEDILDALQEYFLVLDALVGLLKVQVEMNYASLSAHCGEAEKFSHQENKARFIESQHQAYVDAFVQSGLNNPTFCKELEKILPSSRSMLEEKSALVRTAVQVQDLHPKVA